MGVVCGKVGQTAREGKVHLAPFLAAKIPLDRLVADGFEALVHHNHTAVKFLVHPWEEGRSRAC